MKERLLVLALAAGALALFYILFFPKPQSKGEDEAVFPLSTESRPDGYLAVWRWLGAQRVPEASLRYRYDRLPALLPRSTGNLLIMTMPQRVPARRQELAQLKEWVEAGNTLLILAAVDEKPLWSYAGDPLSQEKLQELTGLALQAGGVGPAGALLTGDASGLKEVHLDITPRGEHPLLSGVRHVSALSRGMQLAHQPPDGLDVVLPLTLAARADSGAAALWLEKRGTGQILVSTVVSPFSNRAVLLDDNARLLANIVAWCRGEGGTVVFDDAHQGAAAYYDASVFYADPRLHRTLLWIVALWLAFVLGGLPLRAGERRQGVPDERLYIEASARYLAAVVRPGEAAQRLIERFLEGLQAGAPTGGERSQWERFDAHPRVLPDERRALHTLYERACSGGRVDLTHLQNLLAKLRGILE
jgi:hypothetical protein